MRLKQAYPTGPARLSDVHLTHSCLSTLTYLTYRPGAELCHLGVYVE